MHRSRFLVIPLVFLLFTFSSAAKASAQCGGDNQLACFPWVCDVSWYGNCLIGHPDLTQPSCNAGLEAILGFCQHCGAQGQFVCPSRGCDSGLINVLGFCQPCGGDLQPACPSGCDTRFNNILGVCVACGGNAQFICQQGDHCDAGLAEVVGSCYLCGQAGQVTCAGDQHCANDRLNEVLGFCIACGGNLQPLCADGAACDAGLVGVAGLCVHGECGGPYQVTCATGPLCNGDRFNAIPPVPTAGVCIPCGHDGEPVCLNGVDDILQMRQRRPCDRFNAEAGVGGVALCERFDPEPEPGTGTSPTTAVPPAASPDAEIVGFADIHTHMLANLGFGGSWIWGAPFDPDGITYALPWCDFTQDFMIVNQWGLPLVPSVPFFGYPVHGPLHSLDIVAYTAGQEMSNQGGSSLRNWAHLIPDEGKYDGWPNWKSFDHQLMYHKWIERAYLGGQRLMVMLAVNNKVICDVINHRASYGSNGGAADVFGCTDVEAFDRQITAAREMEQYIDSLNGGPGQGWFRIAESAQQARQIINSGKMAVILGLEAATIFNSPVADGQPPQNLDAQLDYWYGRGVRWVFPIHLWDNDFGGAAINQWVSYFGNFISAGYWFDVGECGPGYGDYGFQFSQQDWFAQNLYPLFGPIEIPPLEQTHTADCNNLGLTPLGVDLMEKLIARKMIIDVDHFSKKAMDQALTIAERHNYPLVASHTRFFDVTHGQERAESAKTAMQVTRMRDLGGIVAPILAPVPGDQISGYGQTVPNDCAGSSKQWAQQYLYALDQMGGGPYGLPAVAFGSDFNAPIRHIAPRFGADGCMGEAPGVHHQAQVNGVEYPFHPFGNPSSLFSKQQTGDRTFDFNTDGLAHVGLLPDLIEDMRKSGLTDAQLGPLFHSAEAVVQMWERIEASTPPPSASYTVSPAPNANGWNNTSVTVIITGTPATGGTAIQQVSYSVGGAAPITVPGATAAVTVGTEGATEISFTVADATHVTAPQTVSVKIDTIPPTALTDRSQPPNDRGWHRSAVTISFTGTDALSGIDACTAPVTLSGEGAGQQASGTCTDLAGNVSQPVVETVNIDLTPPIAHAERSAVANESGWNNTDVTVTFHGEDALSGVFSCSAETRLSTDGANQSASGSCEDKAGNVSQPAGISGINIDRTPPELTASRTTPNGNGWNNGEVTVAFACSDAVSGVSENPQTPHLVTTEGAGQSRTATCKDRAGNTTTATVENINIDKTPPVASPAATPSANAAGWNNSAVTVSFPGTDALSGIQSCTSPIALSNEGANQSASGQCVDKAGNSSSLTTLVVNIDKTAPVASAQATPSPNAAGWNNSAVTVSFSGTDALSGIASCTANTSLTQEGAGQSASGGCVDKAGNSSTVTASGINIDLTAPAMACSANPSVLWPPNHLLVPVTNVVTVTDALSVEGSFRLIAVTNSEPDARVADDALGTDTAADIQGFVLGTSDTEGAVRAERNGNGPGRQYTFRYEASDRAGNRAECTITVAVPHDMY